MKIDALLAARPVVEADGLTCFVKGFDAYDEDAARSALIEAFSPHGEITEVILPMDRESGRLKGFGYVVFANNDGSNVRFKPFPRCFHLSMLDV